jgi:hypothetical protein
MSRAGIMHATAAGIRSYCMHYLGVYKLYATGIR